MGNLLLTQLREALPQGMRVPSELEALYAWIEANRFYDDADGRRRGYLYPQDQLRQSWSDGKREGGTEIVFFTDEPKNSDKTLRYWFCGKDRELAAEIKQRLCVFARSGSDGSSSTMTCVLAHNGLDFLRLIAIGYDEICWDENFSMPPNSEGSDFIVYPNVEFQQWIEDMFKTTIPQTAIELVTPAHMDDENSNDEFLIWVNRIVE